MQTARRTVRTGPELSAGVQLREHDLDAGQSRARLDVDGDAAGSISHFDAPVGVQHDLDRRAVAGQRLIDRVVDDLPQAVHQTAGIRRSDVHSGALAHSLQALEHLQMMGGVLGGHNRSDYAASTGSTGSHAALGAAVRAQRNVTQ